MSYTFTYKIMIKNIPVNINQQHKGKQNLFLFFMRYSGSCFYVLSTFRLLLRLEIFVEFLILESHLPFEASLISCEALGLFLPYYFGYYFIAG